MKNEFQIEYESYMKKVTDAFVNMQSDKIYGTIGHNKDEVFYEVIWNGGLEYSFDGVGKFYIKGITLEEMKKYNADIAKKYLLENSLSYDEWFNKYKGKLHHCILIGYDIKSDKNYQLMINTDFINLKETLSEREYFLIAAAVKSVYLFHERPIKCVTGNDSTNIGYDASKLNENIPLIII